MPDAVKKKLAQNFTFLASYGYGSRLRRMPVLPMVSFGSRQIPTIFLQHLQNIFDLILFHIIECFDYAGKGTNNNTYIQTFLVKSIKIDTIFLLYEMTKRMLDFQFIKHPFHFLISFSPSQSCNYAFSFVYHS